MKAILPVALVALMMLALVPAASAHAHATVLDRYQLSIGWVTEPPMLDSANGVFVSIKDMGAPAHHDEADGHDMTEMGPGHADHAAGHDVEHHGAIFMSEDLAPGESFNFTFNDSFVNNTIPYHDHWSGHSGNITVAMGELNGTVAISITDDGFVPSNISVAPGTTIVWTNAKLGANDAPKMARVVSGPHSSAGYHDGDMEKPAKHGHGDATPVMGAEATVKVEVSIGGKSRTFDLVPIEGKNGTYAAPLTPTVTGVYTVRIFGTLDGKAFETTTEIQRVEASTAPQWPEQGPTVFEASKTIAQKDAKIAGLEAEVTEAKAATKSTPGVGMFAGLVVLGMAALVLRRRV